MIKYRKGCQECEAHRLSTRKVDRCDGVPIEVPTTPHIRAGRRACYEPAIAAVIEQLPTVLKSHQKAMVARYERKHPRTKGMFSVDELEWVLYRTTTVARGGYHDPKARYADLDQSKVSPIRRAYEFPAKTRIYHSTYLRQMTKEERRIVVHYAMLDYLASHTDVERVEDGKGLRYRFVGS